MKDLFSVKVTKLEQKTTKETGDAVTVYTMTLKSTEGDGVEIKIKQPDKPFSQFVKDEFMIEFK